VRLTPAGIELVDSVLADLMEHETKLLGRLSPDEQEALIGLLRKLLSEFE
jgi:DNA-binding MarR family transcriptional regulator